MVAGVPLWEHSHPGDVGNQTAGTYVCLYRFRMLQPHPGNPRHLDIDSRGRMETDSRDVCLSVLILMQRPAFAHRQPGDVSNQTAGDV